MEKRMSRELLRKHFQSRWSQTVTAATAVVGVMVLLATQGMGTAVAGTDANRSNHLDVCPQGQACLWINAADDPDPAVAADSRALIITPGSGPDLDDPASYGLGRVHGVTAEFTDNISNGWNNLPYDLCLMDTTDYDGYEVSARTSSFILVVKPGKSFTQLADWNDKIDYYTTAQKGQCPRGGITFRPDTQEILNRW
jgi:hypothetical protein